MLARVTSGKDGIVEYLEHGVKSGRELSRDELDERVCIDGSLSVTDQLISQLNDSGRESNYLHVTLSFGERDISEETIIEAYSAYKQNIMNAYDSDEYNIYAEIHFPKIKSYKDRKTGDIIERFPHVHIVIPKTNIVTGKSLDPYGYYKDNIDSHDAIQESVNRKLGLESPYDNQRKYRIIKDDSEFISRYKGDTFKGNKAAFKTELFDLINTKNIRTMNGFEKELSKYGEVSKGKLGDVEEYFKIKLKGESKNIRLKETCFKSAYIIDRELLRPKPTDKQVNSLVNEWVNTRSHEMKHIHPESKKLRSEYYSLDSEKKEEFLHERRTSYNTKYDLGTARRATNRKLGIERVGLKRFTQIRNGLPGLPQRSLVRANRERTEVPESLLSHNANNNLESSRTSRDHQLRWPINRSGGDGARGRIQHDGRVEIGLPKPSNKLTDTFNKVELLGASPRTLSEQLLQKHAKEVIEKKEIEYFREVRKSLDPERILNHFEKSHGLVKDNYTTFRARDGSARIKIGSRAFNVSDFCTKHMHQNWDDTKKILSDAYRAQGYERDDKHVINSIVFVSKYVTQGYSSKEKQSRLNESIMILKFLQQQEKYGDKMSLDDLKKYKTDIFEKNSISSADASLKSTTENFKRQQAIAKELTLKMSDLVAVKDLKKQRVDFVHKDSGEKLFHDIGDKIIMNSRKPELDHVAAAMTLAAEKFGVVKISGTKEFKRQVIDIAVAKDLKIVFDSPKMQELFIQQKQLHNQKATEEQVSKNVDDQKAPTSDESKVVKSDPGIVSDKDNLPPDSQSKDKRIVDPVTLVEHGKAPYLNDKENKASYYVTLSNGKTLWGVGLKEALEESKAKVGDEVLITKDGSKTVQVDTDIKNEQGKVIAVEKIETERVTWNVEVKGIKHVEASNSAKFDVKYKWLEDEKKMEVTINSKSPKLLATTVLEKIIKNDKFLSSFSIDSIRTGKLDLALANGEQPVPRQFDRGGNIVVQIQEVTHTTKLTQ